jgi:hypothetical protein
VTIFVVEIVVSDGFGLVAGSTGFAVVMMVAALAGAGIVAARTRASAIGSLQAQRESGDQ